MSFMGPKGRGFAQKIVLLLWNGIRQTKRAGARRCKKLWHARLRQRSRKEVRL